MNYYDTNIYYLMYAGSSVKIKMRKSNAFYRVQLDVLMHARRSYVSLTCHSSEASNTTYLRALIRLGVP